MAEGARLKLVGRPPFACRFDLELHSAFPVVRDTVFRFRLSVIGHQLTELTTENRTQKTENIVRRTGNGTRAQFRLENSRLKTDD